MYTSSAYFPFPCMAVSLLVGLLPYLININIGIYPVLNNVSFFFLETFLGCLYICSEYLPFPCMSVSVLLGSVSFWNYINLDISPVLDDTSIWNLLDTFTRYFSTVSEVFLIYCMSVSLWVNLLPCWNKANLGTSWVLDELSFWIS